MPNSEIPRVCLPAELFGRDREEAARRARQERPDNAPSWRAVSEVAPMIGPEAAVFLTGALWPQERTIKVSFMDVTSSLQDAIRGYLERLYEYTNLSLQFVASGGEIRIATQPGGSWSYLGSQALQIRSGQTMNFGWLDNNSSDTEIRSVVLHEGGHSIGMGHGHKNPKTPWQWDREAVIRDLSGPPNNWSEAQIESNVLSRYTSEEVSASDPDFDSIMTYTVPNSWTLGDYEVERNTDLSPRDIQWLGKTYPTEEEPEEPEKPRLKRIPRYELCAMSIWKLVHGERFVMTHGGHPVARVIPTLKAWKNSRERSKK